MNGTKFLIIHYDTRMRIYIIGSTFGLLKMCSKIYGKKLMIYMVIQ